MNDTANNDTITGTKEDDVLFGKDGDDLLIPGDGNDFIYGGPDNDTVDFSTVSNPVSGSLDTGMFRSGNERDFTYHVEGVIATYFNDTISGSLEKDTISGNAGDDTLDGFESSDTLYGNAGNDFISGSGGRDILYGNEGNDTLNGGNTEDTLHGGQGNDFLIGEGGSDLIQGNEGDDTIQDTTFKFAPTTLDGGEGNDLIHGNMGNDYIISGKGSDTIDGKEGEDTLSYKDNETPIIGNLIYKSIKDGDYFDNVSGVEHFILTDKDDVFVGGEDAASTTIEGGKGGDWLKSGEENTTFIFREGDSKLENPDTVVVKKGDKIKLIGAKTYSTLRYQNLSIIDVYYPNQLSRIYVVGRYDDFMIGIE